MIDAYLELLAGDRSLLVPILGSLADMPLEIKDKNAVIEATEVFVLAIQSTVSRLHLVVSHRFVAVPA